MEDTDQLHPVGFRDEKGITDVLFFLTYLMSTEEENADLEKAHRNADEALIHALRAFGQFAGREKWVEGLIARYEKIDKWYA